MADELEVRVVKTLRNYKPRSVAKCEINGEEIKQTVQADGTVEFDCPVGSFVVVGKSISPDVDEDGVERDRPQESHFEITQEMHAAAVAQLEKAQRAEEAAKRPAPPTLEQLAAATNKLLRELVNRG